MDYDRYDAFLHHIFKQTQGDAWFRPSEDNLSAGVALRVDQGRFRVFPYENLELEPFETAVSALNPVVAVKVRSAAVHAVLAEAGPDDKSIYVDANTRIQILDTMMHLPRGDKEQCAAFIRDERVMVIWSDDLDSIIPTCKDFEDRLIKLLWRQRPPMGSGYASSIGGSMSGHGSVRDLAVGDALLGPNRLSRGSSNLHSSTNGVIDGADLEKMAGMGSDESSLDEKMTTKRGCCGLGKKQKVMRKRTDERPVRIFAPIYNGLAFGLSAFFICFGVSVLLTEFELDNDFMRFILCVLIPFLFCVSLFFSLQIFQNISYAVGPIAQYWENSKYYSAIPPKANKIVDNNLPHVTIQMPVYKESLDTVLAPSIESIKKAMQTYARQGGTSSIFVNDDGMQIISPGDRDARMAFYAQHGIGWVARPKHDNAPDGYKRAGRFKKASNMNYGLALSLKLERHLAALMAERKEGSGLTVPMQTPGPFANVTKYGSNMQLNLAGVDEDDYEERALLMAIEETYEESGRRFRPWAANGKACRIGEIVLIVDSDTIVPEDCFRDAARELAECPTVGVIQHESDVMQVAHHYFENGIAYFTRRINKCISMTCANGEVAPFVGHNAFLRWKAVQDAAFIDPVDGKEKVWSEMNVSEDFDMALRLQLRGYIIRWATYSNGGFKEGVSLTVDDELNRWQKYAFGCSELLFNPFIQWFRKGPINHQIHKFLWSSAPLHYKVSMMSYMFSYYGISVSVTIGLVNYILLGFQFPVDGYYIHSWEIWLATTVVFLGLGNLSFTLLEYRLGKQELVKGFFINVMWLPFFFFFFGGLAIHISQAILAHMFSYNMTWAATKKEVERSNFFKEIPKILKRFWLSFAISFIIMAGMIIVATPLVPLAWRIDGGSWAVIFPLAVAVGCHILFPIVLNPWLMVFSY